MIEIIDKINNTISKVKDEIEIILDPNGNTIFIKDYHLEGKVIYGIIHKEDGTTLFLYTDENKKRARDVYDYVKYLLKKKGYNNEIEWCKNIPSIETQDKLYFFQEYCWVVVNSGMKNTVAKKIFKKFWNNGNFDFNIITHPNKKKAIKTIYNRLDFHFEHLKRSENKLKYLESLPHIGLITKYHLARNLGLNYAKPDRHLVRIASLFGYNDVQSFCKDVSDLSGDKIGVVDLVFWRFATLSNNYLEIIKNLEKVR